MSRTDALGRTTRYTYDAHGSLKEFTTATASASNTTISAATDPLGSTTTCAHDGRGEPQRRP